MSTSSTPIYIVHPSGLTAWKKSQPKHVDAWLSTTAFSGKDRSHTIIPSATGGVASVLCVADSIDVATLGNLPYVLPEGTYHITTPLKKDEATAVLLGWRMGSYRFKAYKSADRKPATLIPPKGADIKEVDALMEGITLARDLINTPANDMHTEALANAALGVAKQHKGKATAIVGDALLKANYPLIYAVGKASIHAPRLVDIRWGNPKHKKITLVGKGVCFDSGGLDIKPSSNMKMMKKDMGGAAVMLGLAHVIMSLKMPVCLRVLLPIVENSIAGNAMRPSDVVKSRKGLTVEIGNTDAEGRLILCDALFEADSEAPDLLIDAATLTGAARVALGTDLPALFSTSDEFAEKLQNTSYAVGDPVYRLPLHAPYRSMLNSSIADICNDPESGQGGAITAALFLKEFVGKAKVWAHLDMMAWNTKDTAAKPKGGEAQALRALYSCFKQTLEC